MSQAIRHQRIAVRDCARGATEADTNHTRVIKPFSPLPRMPIVRPPCPHNPSCPGSTEIDATAALIIKSYAEQGRYLLCNGIVLWTDGRIERPESSHR